MTQLFVTDEKSKRRFLVDTGAQVSVTPASWADKVSVSTHSDLALIEPTSNRFRKILNSYPQLLQPTFSTAEVKHGVKHFIPTKDRPVFARARRLAPDKLASAKREFFEMENMGIIQKSNSPWASPLHMVPKSNGDYRRLNDATVPDRYPIPHIQDFIQLVLLVKAFSPRSILFEDIIRSRWLLRMCLKRQ
ncbi:transposon ty3-g Gag-Pol polyprotein [Plakobranchus ocellatus]|uniref:Transposon ty3-g Gag-Pol polyprotein n=1 Tax=Plakobranchus ocellatus TaxID=259542 RepID=A0AAV4D852_9GAST|nr:transposon ty3-g Gag-Pol polyprotein [Plakobranchus ocellatus]